MTDPMKFDAMRLNLVLEALECYEDVFRDTILYEKEMVNEVENKYGMSAELVCAVLQGTIREFSRQLLEIKEVAPRTPSAGLYPLLSKLAERILMDVATVTRDLDFPALIREAIESTEPHREVTGNDMKVIGVTTDGISTEIVPIPEYVESVGVEFPKEPDYSRFTPLRGTRPYTYKERILDILYQAQEPIHWQEVERVFAHLYPQLKPGKGTIRSTLSALPVISKHPGVYQWSALKCHPDGTPIDETMNEKLSIQTDDDDDEDDQDDEHSEAVEIPPVQAEPVEPEPEQVPPLTMAAVESQYHMLLHPSVLPPEEQLSAAPPSRDGRQKCNQCDALLYPKEIGEHKRIKHPIVLRSKEIKRR